MQIDAPIKVTDNQGFEDEIAAGGAQAPADVAPVQDVATQPQVDTAAPQAEPTTPPTPAPGR